MRTAIRFIFATACFALCTSFSSAQSWPDLAKPAPAVGGGAHDAAVIVAIENYAFVASIPGAKANANAWYDYFIKTRRIPFKNVFRRVDSDVTAEDINGLAARAADLAGKDGTLWFVFIGHGAPSADGKDGLLVGVDAQQKAESLESRGLPQRKLLSTLAKSPAGTIVAVIDACFSGRGVEGKQLVAGLQPLVVVAQGQTHEDPRLVVMTAAQGNEFAGQLPGVRRPAFSYLTLGGLRGWADDDGDGKITADKLHAYADGVLSTMVKDRTQTPVLMGAGGTLIASSAGEKGPDLAELAKLEGAATPFQFRISALPDVPSANEPSISAEAEAVPRVSEPSALTAQEAGIDFGSVNVDALEKYNAAVEFEKGPANPEDKAAKWRELGADVPAYAEIAKKRAKDWTQYAEDAAVQEALAFDKSSALPSEKAAKWREVAARVASQKEAALKNAEGWERYAIELAAIEKARRKREKIRDADYAKLKRLLALSVVSATDKQNWSEMFVKAYGGNCTDDPYLGDIAPFLSDAARSGLPTCPSSGTIKTQAREESMETTTIHGGALNLDINYPGVGVRYFLSDKFAIEGGAQFAKKDLVAGPRLYWYPRLLSADSKLSPYLCAEGDYVSFKGAVTNGTGLAGGAFAGIEYSLSRTFSLQIDAGGEYFSVKDKGTSLAQTGLEFILEFGVNFYPPFGANARTPRAEEESVQKSTNGSSAHVRDSHEKCVSISQIGAGFEAWRGTDIDVLQDDPVCYVPTGLGNFDAFFDAVNNFVGKVRVAAAVVQAMKAGRTTASNGLSLNVAAAQLLPLLGKAVEESVGIVKQGQGLVTSAPSQFSGFKAFKLPGVLSALKQSLDNLSSAIGQGKDALAGLQAASTP